MKKTPLLSEFSKSTYEEWKTSAEELLKGAPFDKKMYTDTVEGIRLSPIYRREDIQSLKHLRSYPGQPGSPRGSRRTGYLEKAWGFMQEIPIGNVDDFNKILLEQLNRGQNAVVLQLDSASAEWKDPAEAGVGEVGACGLSLCTVNDMEKALHGVLAEGVSFHLYPGFISLPMVLFFIEWSRRTGVDTEQLRGSIHSDPIAVWAMGGELPMPWEQCLDNLAQSGHYLRKMDIPMDFIGVSGMPYHNAGASAVDELGIVLAVGLTYLREMSQRGWDTEEVARKMSFTLSLGSNFFMDLAKIRAFRLLWAQVLAASGIDDGIDPRLYGRTALYNKTVHDPYVNLLRTSTEAFCGILGGLDGITVGTLDECIRVPETFTRRISTNTHIILSEECELKRVVDPAGGSWYLEKLTDELARIAWKVMQKVETVGGAISALTNGVVQDFCFSSDKKFRTRLHQRRISLIGTNVYTNTEEKQLPSDRFDYRKIQADRSAEVKSVGPLAVDINNEGDVLDAVGQGATLSDLRNLFSLQKPVAAEKISPLPSRRLAADYEMLAAASDHFLKKEGHRPRIFLLNLGPLRKHKIRADFTRSFFESGGFEIIYPEGFDSPENAVASLQKSEAGIVIVCGTDEQYSEQFSSFAVEVKKHMPQAYLLLAGHPGEKEEEFSASGMDDYIWIRSNHYETNKNMLIKCGVKIPKE